jgi:aryl-alcohol dehydrogenase-like predicted oxidoreductase
METVQLGQTDIRVTPLGIGTWAWGDKLFWDYGNTYGEAEIKKAFNASLEGGISFFDTAEIYGLGESESLIGRLMKETGRSPQIATKYFPVPWRVKPETVSEAITNSLNRLQVDYIELYQIHQPVSFLMSQETLLNRLADEVTRGRIQSIGVSNYSAKQMREAHEILAQRGIPLAVNQVKYSLLSRKIEVNGILETSRELGITILAYSPLAQGLLTGKYTSVNTPTGARKLSPEFGREGLRKIAPVISRLKRIADQYKKTPSQVALNWLICQGVIPIPGAKNAKQAQDNVGALGWSLKPEDVEDLEEVTRPWLS